MSILSETSLKGQEVQRLHDIGRYQYPVQVEVGLPFGTVKKLLSINNVPIHTINSKVKRHQPNITQVIGPSG